MNTPTGTRLRCDACGAEFIVLRGADAEASCCGQAITVSKLGPTAPRT